jgi:OOP family OmpA-OmpF porin
MKKITLVLMAIICLSGVTTAYATDQWYVLAGVDQRINNDEKSTVDSILTTAGATGFTSSSDTTIGYKIQLGYQINQNFAVEGGYSDLGNTTYSAIGGNIGAGINAEASITGFDLVAVGIVPVNEQFSLLGKLGVASIKDSVTVSGGGISKSTDGTKNDLTYGIAALYYFDKEHFGRIDVDSYNVGNSTSAKRSTEWSFNIGFKF